MSELILKNLTQQLEYHKQQNIEYKKCFSSTLQMIIKLIEGKNCISDLKAIKSYAETLSNGGD